MRGGAGSGVAAKEISATTDGARLSGKILVCEDMVAIYRRVMEIQNFWCSNGAVRRRFPTLATLRTPASELRCRHVSPRTPPTGCIDPSSSWRCDLPSPPGGHGGCPPGYGMRGTPPRPPAALPGVCDGLRIAARRAPGRRTSEDRRMVREIVRVSTRPPIPKTTVQAFVVWARRAH